MSRLVRLGAALTCALLAAGCYTIRYERRAAPEPGAPREQWHHGLVGGLIDVSGPVHLDKTCPDGFATVQSQTSFPNWLGQALTTGGVLGPLQAPLWSPSTVQVTCARPTAAARTLTVVLLPLAPLGDVKQATVGIFTEALAGELRRRPGVSVLTDSDVAALLGVERRKAMVAGCSDAGCLAELGGALGADRVIHGSVGRVGGSLVVNLSSLNPKRSRSAASVSERLKGSDDEAFLDALPAMADRLLAEAPDLPRPSGKPPMPPPLAEDPLPTPRALPPAK
jgi:hypothetical protein